MTTLRRILMLTKNQTEVGPGESTSGDGLSTLHGGKNNKEKEKRENGEQQQQQQQHKRKSSDGVKSLKRKRSADSQGERAREQPSPPPERKKAKSPSPPPPSNSSSLETAKKRSRSQDRSDEDKDATMPPMKRSTPSRSASTSSANTDANAPRSSPIPAMETSIFTKKEKIEKKAPPSSVISTLAIKGEDLPSGPDVAAKEPPSSRAENIPSSQTDTESESNNPSLVVPTRPPPRNASKNCPGSNRLESNRTNGNEASGSVAMKRRKSNSSSSTKASSSQEWVQCERCKEWRDLPSTVRPESLPEHWYCEMNTWNPDQARCHHSSKTSKKATSPRVTSPRPTNKNESTQAIPSIGVSSTQEVSVAVPGATSIGNPRNSAGQTRPKQHNSNSIGNLGSSNMQHSHSHSHSSANVKSESAGNAKSNKKARNIKRHASNKSSSKSTTQGDSTKGNSAPSSSGVGGGSNHARNPNRGNVRSGPGNGLNRPRHNSIMASSMGQKSSSVGDKRDQTWKWVMCETCQQWRKLPPYVDVDKLPEKWYCAMNKWDPTRASCSAPQEADETISQGNSTPETGRRLVKLPEGVNLYGGQIWPVGRKQMPMNYRELIVNHYRHFRQWEQLSNSLLHERYKESSLFVPRDVIRAKSKKDKAKSSLFVSTSPPAMAREAYIEESLFKKLVLASCIDFSNGMNNGSSQDDITSTSSSNCGESSCQSEQIQEQAATDVVQSSIVDYSQTGTDVADGNKLDLDEFQRPEEAQFSSHSSGVGLLKLCKPWKRAGGWPRNGSASSNHYFCNNKL